MSSHAYSDVFSDDERHRMYVTAVDICDTTRSHVQEFKDRASPDHSQPWRDHISGWYYLLSVSSIYCHIGGHVGADLRWRCMLYTVIWT